MRAAAALLVLVLLPVLPAWGAQPPRATLKLVALAPLVVEGRGFGSGERVALTASASNAQRLLSVVARRNGSLTALFDLRLGRCASLIVRAVGALGSRAILQVEPGCEKKKRRPRSEAGLITAAITFVPREARRGAARAAPRLQRLKLSYLISV